MNENKTLDFIFEIKQISEEGSFEGYASVFNNVDSVNDVIKQGAFTSSLKERTPVLLWQHNREEIIGIFTEIKEDNIGLFVKGKLTLGVQKGKEAYALLKDGAIKSMSIGYKSIDADYDTQNNIRQIKELQLYEISLVTFPANESAKITNVKSIDISELKSLKDYERLFRDLGLSQKDATTIISRCADEKIKHRDGERKAEEERREAEKLEVANIINKFTNKV